ncbi:MAG: hypothetical protein AAF654_03475 [Myxococcota bacterium]
MNLTDPLRLWFAAALLPWGLFACSDSEVTAPSGSSCESNSDCSPWVCDLAVRRCAPPPDAVVYSSTVELSWDGEADGAVTLRVGTDAALSQLVEGFPQDVNASTFEFTPPNDGLFYWTIDAGGERLPVRSFARISGPLHVYCAREPCPEGGWGSASSPFSSIRAAVAVASEFGVRDVRVAGRDSGLGYGDGLLLTRGIRLEGGYSPDFSTRDVSEFETVLAPTTTAIRIEDAQGIEVTGFSVARASGAFAVIRVMNSTEVILRELSLSSSDAERTTGLLIENSDVQASELEMTLVGERAGQFVVGIELERALLDVSDSRFVLQNDGGAALRAISLLRGEMVSVLNSSFDAASASDDGSVRGIFASSSSVVVEGCTFSGPQDAINLSNSAGVVRRNRIDLARGDGITGIVGFVDVESLRAQLGIDVPATRVEGNLIRIADEAGHEGARYFGIDLRNNTPSAFVLHNTVVVYGAGEGKHHALVLDASSSSGSKVAHAVNNIFVTVGGNDESAVVLEDNAASDPESFLSNVLVTEGGVAYADRDGSSTRVDLDEVGIAGTDGTLVPRSGCPDTCAPSRVADNRVVDVLDWRSLFVSGDGADVAEALTVSASSAADILRSSGLNAPATCGTTEDPIDCELPGTDLLGNPFSSPRPVGAISSQP